MHGGDLIAEVLQSQGVPFLFTLCGGHISPILVGCKARGIRVIDTRHEATAVFAADATARLSGRPGVAAVTAGPGLSNTITAVKNAQLSQSPVILLGGATATLLKGRGALQDIDQMALLRPHVKWAAAAGRVAELPALLEKAFAVAQAGVPGPVFIELPLDLLYDEAVVRKLYGAAGGGGRGIAGKALQLYMGAHLARLFGGAARAAAGPPVLAGPPVPPDAPLRAAADALARAERPLLLVGAQALLDAAHAGELAAALDRLGLPAYLSGGARGLLGRGHPLQMRHQRRAALKEADLVILAGVPCDFRLDYGRHIRRGATYVAANRSRADMTRNRRPDIAALGDPGLFLRRLAMLAPPAGRWQGWRDTLAARDEQRNQEIARQAEAPGAYLNPLALCRQIEAQLPDDSIIVGDGGDFVATASYVVSPRGPLRWLDPGPYGTLGVGAGFALGAALCRPESEVWALFGDGAFGYSLAELDTFARHGIPVIAVVGNDAGWTQIAREQGEMLGDLVGTELAPTAYHLAAEGLGAAGLLLDDPELTEETLAQARDLARAGRPVLINARLGKTEFRKGSISV